MKYKLDTQQFEFIRVDFYESIADPRYIFDLEEEELDSGKTFDELWRKFNFDWYRAEWIPYIQSIADRVVNEMKYAGLISIKVTKVDSPVEYNFQSDWAEMEVEVEPDWKERALSRSSLYWADEDCMKLVRSLETRGWSWSFTPQSTKEWEDAWGGKVYYADEILLGFYLSMEFILKFGPEEANDNFEEATDRFRGNESLFNFIEEEKEMNKEDFQNLILSTEVGRDIRVSMTKEDAKKMRVHIIRAEKYGYKICCVLLYANIYYLEKLQEGDKEKYESTRKHWGCKKQ